MRPAAVTKVVGAALLLMVVVALGTSVATADFQQCVQACADQWAADKQACADALQAALANIAAQEEACINACAPTNFLCQANCVRQGNIRRYNANSDYRRCVNVANTVAWNCYRNCQQSVF